MDMPHNDGGVMGLPLTSMTGIAGVSPAMVSLQTNSAALPTSSWHFYNKKAFPKDTALVAGVKDSMNILLVFAGLFSATATAFLTFTLPLLQPNDGETTNRLLVTIINKMGNSSYQAPDISDFIVPPTLLIANCLVSASVAGNLLAAFCAILITQWAKNFTDGLQSIENEQYRARMRHFRFQGAKEWHLFDIAEVVPTLLHVSLTFFACGAILFLFTVNHTVGIVTATILGAGACSYFALSITPLWSKAAPFRSPLTALLEYCCLKVPMLVLSLLVILQNYLHSLVKGNYASEDTVDAQVDILGREKPLYQFVHKKWDLDVSVLVHLMQSADRHSERNVLETCLVDLQTLFKVEEETPELFDDDEILSTYFFLGKYCLHSEGAVPYLLAGQRDRGLKLCTFLAWFLELSDRWPKEQQTALKRRMPLTEDNHLPRAARRFGKGYQNIEIFIAGYLAGNSLQHLHGGHEPGCWCFNETSEHDIYAKLMDFYDPNTDTSLSIGNLVIRYISCQTRCLAARSGVWDQPLPPWINRIARVATRFRLYDSKFQSSWESFLVQYERRADLTPLVVAWIGAIQEVARGRLPIYTATVLPGIYGPMLATSNVQPPAQGGVSDSKRMKGVERTTLPNQFGYRPHAVPLPPVQRNDIPRTKGKTTRFQLPGPDAMRESSLPSATVVPPTSTSWDHVQDSGQSLAPLGPMSNGEFTFPVNGGMANQTAMYNLANTLPNQAPPPGSTRFNIIPGIARSDMMGLPPPGALRFNIRNVAPPGVGRPLGHPLPSQGQIVPERMLSSQGPVPETDEEPIIPSGRGPAGAGKSGKGGKKKR